MSKFQDLIEKAMRGEPLDEVSPPGFKGTVKAMKKRHSDEIDNPYALSWWMKNKGYKSHKKATGGPKDESKGGGHTTQVPLRDATGDPQWERAVRTARMFLDVGRTADEVRLEAEQQERSGFEDAARFGLMVSHAMEEMDSKTEMKGGGAPVTAGNLAGTTEYPSDHQLFVDEALGGVPEGTRAFYIFRPEQFGDKNIGVEGGYSWSHRDPRSSDPGVTSTAGARVRKPEDIERWLRKEYGDDISVEVVETTGDNWSQTSGTGSTGIPTDVATDALPLSHTYDMDIGKLPESFDFSEARDTLAATKGIKKASQKDEDGKKIKMMKEPEGAGRPDYKELGAKDVNGADNLSDEAINDEMENSAYEDIRIDHAVKGRGTVLEITETHIVVDWDKPTLRILGPERLPLSETKYIIRIKERYASDPEEIDVEAEEPKGKKKMAKKQKVDEAMVAIQPTMRMSGDGYKLPVIDLSPEDIGLVNEIEVPDPGDSVLTGQDQQKAPQVAPLSTERGAEAAHDDIYPDGDFGKDLVPGDAPGTPDYDELGDDAGNPRAADGTDNPAADVSGNSSGSSDDHQPKDYDEKKWGDSDKSKDNKVTGGDSDSDDDAKDDDDDEDKNMKEDKNLTWSDIGLDVEEVITEMADAYEDETCEGCGMKETHDTGSGEVGFTPELLHKLMAAVRDQSPDDDKLQRMCDALSDASSEKGATLDDSDMSSIMDKYKNGGGAAADASPEMADDGMEDPNSVGMEGEGEDNEAGDVRHKGHGTGGDDDAGVRDDEYGDEAEDDNDDDEDRKYREQDKAPGDGEEAGPEGGDEHEGKTKLMDKKGRDHDGDGDVDSEDWKMARDKAIKSKQRRGERKDKADRKYASMEDKGKSIKPVSQNTSKGSGPGGGNVSNDGQDPLIPAMDKGNQRGTPGTPLSKEGGGRTVKPVSESMVAVGMAGIGSTVRDVERHSKDDDGLTEDERELREIKRRAGLEDWWK